MDTPSPQKHQVPISADRLVAIAYGFRSAKTLMSAVELGVFTALADGPLTADKLRERIGLAERCTLDFLDALVGLDVLQRDQSATYSNTPESHRFFDRGNPDYIGTLLEHLSTREYGIWGKLTAALQNGEQQNSDRSLAKEGFFDDEPALAAFVKGMTGGSLPAAKALASRFPWQKYESFLDVGTAEGCLPVRVALRHGHIRGVGFDRAPVHKLFDSYVCEYGLSDRLRFFPGDFFNDPFPPADVVVMGRVLHNWNFEAKNMLLAKAYSALPSGGALIVYERLIDDARQTNTAAMLSSLNMLLMTPGGYDFTAADCIGWMQHAGFRDCCTEPLTAEVSMIVGVK
jgi:hypothetical protein